MDERPDRIDATGQLFLVDVRSKVPHGVHQPLIGAARALFQRLRRRRVGVAVEHQPEDGAMGQREPDVVPAHGAELVSRLSRAAIGASVVQGAGEFVEAARRDLREKDAETGEVMRGSRVRHAGAAGDLAHGESANAFLLEDLPPGEDQRVLEVAVVIAVAALFRRSRVLPGCSILRHRHPPFRPVFIDWSSGSRARCHHDLGIDKIA